MPEIMLYPKLNKVLIYIFGCVCFVGLGIWQIEMAEWIGWVTISFFGLCILGYIINLLPTASYLKLSTEGFEIYHFYRTNFTKWSDVNSIEASKETVLIVYEFHIYSMKPARDITMFITNRRSNSLLDNYRLSVSTLADLMNEYFAYFKSNYK